MVQGLIALSRNRFFKSKDMLKRNASVWLKLMRRQAVAGREDGFIAPDGIQDSSRSAALSHP